MAHICAAIPAPLMKRPFRGKVRRYPRDWLLTVLPPATSLLVPDGSVGCSAREPVVGGVGGVGVGWTGFDGPRWIELCFGEGLLCFDGGLLCWWTPWPRAVAL